MSIQTPTEEDISKDEFGATREFLRRFGIAPQEASQLVEDDILRAIRHKGWEPHLEREDDPPGWKAEIQEWRTISQSRSAIARDRNRVMALLRALRIALTWTTAEEDFKAFDVETRTLLGMSAAEFLQRFEHNELPLDDPRVVHLVIARPFGW